MKLSTAFLLVASTAAVTSAQSTIRNPSAMAKVLSKARRLEDAAAEGDDAAPPPKRTSFSFSPRTVSR